MTTSNMGAGVASSSAAPASPPTTVGSSIARRSSPGTGAKSRRKAKALASVPGNSATVEETLAITGGSPAATIAGKLTNDPPPATAFIAPAISPAAASRAM